ncbi:transcriptional regulator, GntR family [Sphaerochaeta associata]|uniref:GntR family transcriptional regulator n=1 Tax=Sphaerochaeta associata TaxID=1129264 RepID=A0ABY4DC18_9SPIR|nr:GntR family transcriptional regulator [Sphaerochaeta associata]UOM51812.1 GntR family transcriptional regulator [Sphaerochaeta associata]SMP60804.1 transcriptional regulator, GntR family [Sphaerochaeta associata]
MTEYMNGSPQYLKIYDDIRKKIKDGRLAPGMKLSTEQEIATQFGVSRPTVRQALLELEREGLLERYRGKGTFITNSEQKSSDPHANVTIGIIVPRLADIFIGKIITGVQEVLEKKGYTISVHLTNDNIEKEQEIIESLIERQVEGLIIHPTAASMYNPAIFKLIEKHIPFVMTGRYYKYAPCNSVEMDNRKGAYEAVQYLYEKGHRKIGLVSKPSLTKTSIEHRIEGFFQACRDLDIPVHLKNIFLDLVDTRSLYWAEQTTEEKTFVHNQIHEYLAAAKDVTAIIALNDLIAADLIHVLEELGRKPGVDISVIGFDNVNFANQLKPPLASVETPTFELGRKAAELLIQLISDRSHPVEHILLPSKLVVRGSISECSTLQ